jgi:hypothetical protein
MDQGLGEEDITHLDRRSREDYPRAVGEGGGAPRAPVPLFVLLQLQPPLEELLPALVARTPPGPCCPREESVILDRRRQALFSRPLRRVA